MKPLLAIFSARLRMLLQYRAAAMAGVATQLFWGLIRVMIFTAFYASTAAAQPMTLEETITYVWLGQAMLLLVMFRADDEVARMIHTGTVAYELARPVDLYALWYARAAATRLAPLALRMGPVLLFAFFFFDMELPASAGSFLLFLLSAASALLLSAAINTLLTLSMLWTLAGTGINRMAMSLLMVTSGLIVPLPLFPAWARRILDVLPFRGLADTPYRIYMAHMFAGEAAFAIAHQLVWAAGLMLLGRALLRAGMRRLVVQGG